jgi:hypothetical protein
MGLGVLEWSVHTTLQFKIRDLLWEGAQASSPTPAAETPAVP